MTIQSNNLISSVFRYISSTVARTKISIYRARNNFQVSKVSGDGHWSGLMHFDCVLSKTVSGGQEQPERQRDMQSGVGSLQVGGQAETQALNTSPSIVTFRGCRRGGDR